MDVVSRPRLLLILNSTSLPPSLVITPTKSPYLTDISPQPNPATHAHQLKLWSELVLSWARHERVFVVNVDSPEPGEVFGNKAIGRESKQRGASERSQPAGHTAMCDSQP